MLRPCTDRDAYGYTAPDADRDSHPDCDANGHAALDAPSAHGLRVRIEIAIGVEYKQTKPVIRKWLVDPTIAVNGAPSDGDMAELRDVIADLNALTGLEITVV